MCNSNENRKINKRTERESNVENVTGVQYSTWKGKKTAKMMIEKKGIRREKEIEIGHEYCI